MTARGTSGSLRYGYHVVARVRDWTLAGGRVEGTAEDVNQFYVAHGGPFDLVLHVGKRSWIWRQVTPTVDGARFAATVNGTPENG